GLAVAGALSGRVGTAFEDIGDVHPVTRKTHRLDDPGQKLSGRADKRLALFVFVSPGCFADEHELRMNVANTEHHVLSRTGQVRTLEANERALAKFSHRLGFCGWVHGG